MFRIRIQNKKKCIWYCSAVVSFLLFLLLLGWTNHLANTQDAQQMAGRWSEKKDVAQISCFFSSKAEVTEDTIQSFEYSLKNVLQEASITETSENPSARLWVDAYSGGRQDHSGQRGKIRWMPMPSVSAETFLCSIR